VRQNVDQTIACGTPDFVPELSLFSGREPRYSNKERWKTCSLNRCARSRSAVGNYQFSTRAAAFIGPADGVIHRAVNGILRGVIVALKRILANEADSRETLIRFRPKD